MQSQGVLSQNNCQLQRKDSNFTGLMLGENTGSKVISVNGHVDTAGEGDGQDDLRE